MPQPFRRSLPIAGVAVLLVAALASAETPAGPAPHVRAETHEARALVDELAARSATARALVDRIQASDVIVYVRHRTFEDPGLDGRTGLLGSDPARRFLVVELACGRAYLTQLVTLGHELQHAVEIADVATAFDASSLAALYSRIGERQSRSAGRVTFETRNARDTALQVRRELLTQMNTATRTERYR
jgi:hypothetical protein